MPKTKSTWFQKIENMHPYQTMMYLGMFGSGLIFLFMTIAFLTSNTAGIEGIGFRMPKSFILSTFIILISGFSASRLLVHYKDEQIEKLKNSLLLTFFLGLIFTVLQFMGWKELSGMGVEFQGFPSGSFLYVLSGIHIFHLIGAMIFSVIMLIQISNVEKDEIQHLLMLTNPYEKMRLKLFTTYWHFMDVIWLILFLVFIITF